ncbi:Uncharacterized protein dnm_082000 [Desulfonema magnum]|uniref:Uncharacterized protein n=1 Tax=Desulfonema magnum TaxID=45655 RepID=A0A975BVX8_9BACT|nr:Uncharacterized protein dnm_082000 [Desulfonema magnum]
MLEILILIYFQQIEKFPDRMRDSRETRGFFPDGAPPRLEKTGFLPRVSCPRCESLKTFQSADFGSAKQK